MLRYYYNDTRCMKIFFIACHDGGYKHDLAQYIPDMGRLVLVETTPAVQMIRSLGIPITQFNEVFRGDLLHNENTFAAPSYQVRSAPTSLPPADPQLLEEGTFRSGNGGVSVTYPKSYAAAGGANGHHNIEIGQNKAVPDKIIMFNKNGIRLDPPLKPPGQTPAQASYKRKLLEAKGDAFCNHHYLSGACSWGSTCNWEHNIKLNAEELAIHRYRARSNPCNTGPTCMDYFCQLSHHCPRDPSCNRGVNCKFKSHDTHGDMHLSGEDLKTVYVIMMRPL